MRGKLSSDKPILSATGITPADAGKTRGGEIPTLPYEDHPRGCGENCIDRVVHLPIRGITPADAGKTLQSNVLTSFFTDHPRGCGENPPYHNYLFGR